MPDARPVKLFAWDGMEFPIPADWDLSGFVERRRVASITLEDALAVRLEMDWTAVTGRNAVQRVQQHHARFSEGMHAVALSVEELSDCPAHWVVFLYTLPESTRLVTALHVGEQFPFFVFARFHAVNRSRRELVRDVREALTGFRYQREGPIAWRAFDMAWQVPRRFRLAETSFLAGRKMMVFESKSRRLFLWRLSLADRLLRDQTPAAVAAAFLNRFKGLPGVRFKPDGEDRLVAGRSPWHPFGHYDEIGRGCFRYAATVNLDRAHNALMIVVFHYRTAADRQWLSGITLDGPAVTDLKAEE